MNPLSRSTSNFLTTSLAAALLLSACGKSATPASEPTPTPVPTATPVASATATASPSPAMEVAKYNATQQAAYNQQAVDAFVAQRAEKSQPYLEAHSALEAAGSVNPKGLNSKEAIAARRDLIAKCIAANDIYLDFVKAQETIYRAELAKTPLLPGDVDSLVSDFAVRANTAAVVKLREAERATLQAGDEMLATLDKSYGDWSVNAAGAMSFKKKPAAASFNAAAQKYNKLATDEAKMLAEVNKSLAVPSASATPAPTAPGAAPASPAVSPTP